MSNPQSPGAWGQPPGGAPPQAPPQHGYSQPPQQGQGAYAPPGHMQPGFAPQGMPQPMSSGIVVQANQGLQWLAPAPKGIINGHLVQLRWGYNPISLGPGQHQICVYYRWIFYDACKAQMMVQVQPGHMTMIHYETVFFAFAAGTMHVMGFQPTGY